MASSENPDFKLKDKPRQQFNKIRRILLRNIPPSTEGEIKEFLGRFKAEKVDISESLDSAIVTLQNGSQLEEAVTQLDNKKLKDNDVTVTFCASDKLICVAHLPPRYSDEDLQKMMEEHGKMKTCFIIRSEKTGHSKSYALLEFEEQDVDKVRQIRDDIDWKEVGSHLLHADFIEPSYQTWERLQSRCLAVSGLPKDFTETNKLREMFSVVTSPVYCQIVMLEKESLGMGIVEFRKPEEAEETWEKVRDSKIEDKEITVTFCIPSKSAVFINNRIMWKFSDKVQKSSLLPDPVAAKPVISNNAIVMSLVKQNPNLIEDFTKVLAEFHQAYVNHMMSPGNKPGLLGPAPTLPMSPMMNPHLQMGLIIMLVLHIHAEKKEPFIGVLAKQLNSLSESPSATQSTDSGKKPSILGDPMTAQANIVLSNLKKQLNQVPVTEEDKRVVTSSSPAVRAVMAKFMQNARFLNLNLLVNLGQMVMNMHASSQHDSPVAQAAAAAASSLARHSGGGSLLNPPGSGKGLLGDVPRPNPNPATMRFMKTLEAVASQKIGGQNRGLLSAIMTNINVNPAIGKLEKKTSLLGEPPQHLRQQKDGGSGGGMGGLGGRNMGNTGNMGGMGGNMGGMGGNMGGMGGMGGMDMGNMSGMGGMDNMGGGMGSMGGGMGNMGGGMGNMGGGMGNMGGGMGSMGGGMGNMGGGMGNMGGGMGNMGGGMGNMGGGMGNMGGGMGNMGGGMGNMGGGMGVNMGGGMGGNMGGGMGGGMGGSMAGGMGDMSGMGQQSGNKQNWGSGAGQGSMGRGASGNTNTGNKADSYSTFGSYSGGYGDMSGYGSGYTEEYSQFNQGDYNSSGYGDASMYGGDQSGYQYSDYSGNYNTGQDSYNFQGSNNYSGNFGDYTGGYSGSNSGNTGFNFSQNQSGNVQDGGRFGGGGGGSNWGTQGGSNVNTSGGMGNGMQNMGMSKNFSGGGAGPGGGSGMGQGAGGAFGSVTNAQSGFGGSSSGGARQGLLNTPRGSGGSSNMGGNYGAQGSGTTGMGRSNTSAESYQTSSGQGYMTGNNMGGSTNMSSYSGYGSSNMEGYNTGTYDDGSGTGGYDAYSMGDYSSYNQSGYGNTGNMNQMTPAGSKRGYGHLMSKPDAASQGDYGSQQGLGSHYDKRPRLY